MAQVPDSTRGMHAGPLAASAGRLSYLDWLRFLVVLSLAPFHAALSYTGMGVVYVYDTPIRNLFLSGVFPQDAGPFAMRIFTIFMDNWFMHLLFMVSGIAAASSLRKRSAGEFVGERANRLLLPLLLGTLLVISIQSWLRALSFGRFSGGFFSFYPHFFQGINAGPASKGNFDYGQLWFLLYLFVFSVLALPLMIAVKRRGDSSPFVAAARRLSGGALVLLPAIWIAILEGAFRPGWPGFQNLVNDWANFTVYLSFFLFGYAAGTARELLEAMERNRHAALALGLLAFAARLAVYRIVPVPSGYNAAQIVTHAFRGAAAWGLVIAAMGYGRRYLNRESRALSIARDLAFPLYVLHFAPLSAATWLLLGTGLGVWARWGISVGASWVTVAIFTFVARYVPLVRDVLGIRPGRLWKAEADPSRVLPR
ncbi:MAG TPA: acyltransferase family protein [Spirochaetia bacterium]|nr:acyltransferase family protein [Spirochaetia bacterium]